MGGEDRGLSTSDEGALLFICSCAPQALEQEKYSLQRKLECEQLAVLAAQQEVEGVRRRAEEENTLREQRQEQLHARRLHELAALNDELKAGVEELEVQVHTNLAGECQVSFSGEEITCSMAHGAAGTQVL